MVGRLHAEVETTEGKVRAAVPEILHIGWNEAEDVQVPIGHSRKVDGLQNEVAQLYDSSRLERRTDRAVHPRSVKRRVRRRDDCLAQGEAFDRGLALQEPDAAPGRIRQLNAATSARNRVRWEVMRAEIPHVALEVCVLGHAERRADEAIARCAHRNRNAGRRPDSAREHALGRCADDVHAEIAPEALGRREPRAFPSAETPVRRRGPARRAV